MAGIAVLLSAAPTFAQNYNNQALENWYRQQDLQERNAERMQEQQRWMQEQQRETYRDWNSQRPFRGW